MLLFSVQSWGNAFQNFTQILLSLLYLASEASNRLGVVMSPHISIDTEDPTLCFPLVSIDQIDGNSVPANIKLQQQPEEWHIMLDEI